MKLGDVLHERSEAAVRWLTLDRPEALNAFTAADYVALGEAIDAAGADQAMRVVVLTGAGRAFSAGADRSLFEGPLDPATSDHVRDAFGAMLLALARCEKPIIAAVNGLAVGVGATILLHCDLVILADSARLRLPFTGLGLAPEAASSVLLPMRVRWGDALWWLLSSEWVSATEALAAGLAWRVVPDDDLAFNAAAVAQTLAALDPASVAATKRLVLEGRVELVTAALDRENAALESLLGGRSTGD